MKDCKKRSDCPVSNSLDAFGDKWSLLIVRDLIFKKECTYGDFIKSEEKIATNILASRLLSLEENGIIKKLEHPGSKAKVLYRLTEKGINLLPLIVEMNLWAEKYYTLPQITIDALVEVKKDKEKFITDKIEELKNTA